jgi:hypothetical protein
MNTQNNSPTSKSTLSCLLNTFLLVLWLLSSTFSMAHAQEHAVVEEHECQFCFLSENSPSEATHNRLPITLNGQTSLDVKASSISTFYFTCLFLSNSDPPIKFFK